MSYTTEFEFEIGQSVEITVSGEVGEVIARMESKTGDQYLLRYKAANGGAVEKWWDEDALQEPNDDEDVSSTETPLPDNEGKDDEGKVAHFITEVLLADAPDHIKAELRHDLQQHFKTCDCDHCKRRRGEQ